MNVITYPCWDYSYTMSVKGGPGRLYVVAALFYFEISSIQNDTYTPMSGVTAWWIIAS